MAEEGDSSQEKTEEPTGRRVEKAREEGQVPRSKELNTTLVLMAGTAGLLIYGADIGRSMQAVMYQSFALPREAMFDTHQMGLYLFNAALDAAKALAPFMLLLFIASIAGSVALGGWLFSAKSAAPKFSRLDPMKGLARMFSLHSLMELAKAVAKVSVIMFFAIVLLHSKTEEMLGLAHEDIIPAMKHTALILGWCFFWLSCTMILITMIDVPFVIYEHTKNLKMTKQEVKDEYKDSEGKPEVKGRIRQLQHEMSQRRMMADVPKADVIITNPTHFAVALRYDAQSNSAPILLAKGGDQTAFKIREIAEANGVEIVAAPSLARAVYYHSEIGAEIPSGLYMAVAQVLAYVFQLKQFKRRTSPRPKMPEFKIPDNLRRDE